MSLHYKNKLYKNDFNNVVLHIFEATSLHMDNDLCNCQCPLLFIIVSKFYVTCCWEVRVSQEFSQIMGETGASIVDLSRVYNKIWDMFETISQIEHLLRRWRYHFPLPYSIYWCASGVDHRTAIILYLLKPRQNMMWWNFMLMILLFTYLLVRGNYWTPHLFFYFPW